MSGANPNPAGYPGKEILTGSAREILKRLAEGDPLEIQSRCLEHVPELAVFIDYHRVVIRTMARVAHAAVRYHGSPALDDWIRGMIETAVKDLMREDREEERAGIPPAHPWDPRFAFMSEGFGVQPASARAASVAFNDLPTNVRKTFFAIAVRRKKINRYIAEGHGPPEKVRADLRRAVEALSGHLGNRWEGLDEL